MLNSEVNPFIATFNNEYLSESQTEAMVSLSTPTPVACAFLFRDNLATDETLSWHYSSHFVTSFKGGRGLHNLLNQS